MWKTPGFQQVFRVFGRRHPLHNRTHNGAAPVVAEALCYRGKEANSRGTLAEKLGSVVEVGVKKVALPGGGEKYLVKIHKFPFGMNLSVREILLFSKTKE